MIGGLNMIYLDNAATTYPKPNSVYDALDQANRRMAFNAGRGGYKEAKAVSDMIQETRGMIADLVHKTADDVCFESSATESLNIIINGIRLNKGDTVYVSPFEHNAIIRPLFNRKKTIDFNIEIIPFDKITWELDENKLKNMFALHKPTAVFVTHISNVTGYVLPYSNIFRMANKYHSVNVLDCSQSLGVLNPTIENVDYIIFAGHKSLYASFGIAGFICNTNYRLNITKSGGTGSDSLNHDMPEKSPWRYEAGSMNSVAIAGLNESLKWLKNNNVADREAKITTYMLDKLNSLDKIIMYLPKDISKVIGIISITVRGYQASEVGTILGDEFDICVRTGFHCAPYVHDFIGSTASGGTVRVSINAFTTTEEVDKLFDALSSL